MKINQKFNQYILPSLSLIGIIYILLIIFANRSFYFSKFDAEYWKDKFEQSQWVLPKSPRTIGDDGLYLYEGYQLMKGEDPTKKNAEAPPFGKYLIGLSISIFGNGYWYGFGVTLLGCIILTISSYKYFSNKLIAVGLFLLIITDPIITQQFKLTMFDSLLFLFSSMMIFLLHKVVQQRIKSTYIFILLGITIGLFSASKAPLFTPILLFVCLGTILLSTKNLKSFLIITVIALCTYISVYFAYFYHGHSLIDWFNLQKWIVGFYRHSNLPATYGSALTTILINRYQNLYSHQWLSDELFSFTWPFIFLTSIVSIIFIVKNQNKYWYPVILFVSLLFVILNITPFWTRYLVPLIPFFYLLSMKLIKEKLSTYISVFILTGIVVNLTSSVKILFPTPQETLNQFVYDWRNGFFQDMYERIDKSGKSTIKRFDFHRFGLETYLDAEIEAVSITLENKQLSRWISPQTINADITYYTRNLGPIHKKTTINLINENNSWKIAWKWNYLFDNFEYGMKIKTSVELAKRGTIYSGEKKLVSDENGYLVSVLPINIQNNSEDDLIQTIYNIFDKTIPKVAIHERYHMNVLLDKPIRIGIPRVPADDTRWNSFQNMKGIYLESAYTRIYDRSDLSLNTGDLHNKDYVECCTLLYSTTTYEGSEGLDKKYDKQLKGENGGSVIVLDSKGNHISTLLNKIKIDGSDVKL